MNAYTGACVTKNNVWDYVEVGRGESKMRVGEHTCGMKAKEGNQEGGGGEAGKDTGCE